MYFGEDKESYQKWDFDSQAIERIDFMPIHLH
jgi:hypothetical protein